MLHCSRWWCLRCDPICESCPHYFTFMHRYMYYDYFSSVIVQFGEALRNMRYLTSDTFASQYEVSLLQTAFSSGLSDHHYYP